MNWWAWRFFPSRPWRSPDVRLVVCDIAPDAHWTLAPDLEAAVSRCRRAPARDRSGSVGRRFLRLMRREILELIDDHTIPDDVMLRMLVDDGRLLAAHAWARSLARPRRPGPKRSERLERLAFDYVRALHVAGIVCARYREGLAAELWRRLYPLATGEDAPADLMRVMAAWPRVESCDDPACVVCR
jgi:hypothetical protein